MPYNIHPRWGRPLENYATTYDLVTARKRLDVTPSMEAQGVKSISEVVRLGGSAQRPDAKNVEQVTIQTLESILTLALCPRTFHHFSNPPLISGCIELMGTVKVDQRASPFSYEYGYLCFKIVTIAIGASFLERTGNLEMTVANMVSDIDTELMLILSGHVSRVLEHEIEIANGGDDCGWVLGWARVEGRPRLELDRLILLSDVRYLLNMLWDDRELFLKAYMVTYSPGLAGVIFVLWRYLYTMRPIEDAVSSDLLAVPFCEILWRYLLTATTDQLKPLMYINNDLQLYGKAELWNQSPKYVNLDDLRMILQAYTGRMSPIDSRSHAPLGVDAIPVLLHYVTKVIQPGVEIFLPPLIGLTLDRIWDGLDNVIEDAKPAVSSIGITFMLLCRLVRPLNHAYYASRTAVVELVETLAERNLPDLIARTMILLVPYSVEPSPAYDETISFLENAGALCMQLEEIVPKNMLKAHFIRYVFDWVKFDQQLVMLERSLSEDISPYARHFQACRRIWHQIAVSLAFESSIKELSVISHYCSYPRCSSPKPINIHWLACGLCCEWLYCSTRCQAKDWEADYGYGKRSHRQSCARQIRPFTSEERVVFNNMIRESLDFWTQSG